MVWFNARGVVHIARGVAVGCLLIAGVAPPIAAQPPATSQVLGFTATIPGQPDATVALRLRLFAVSQGGAPVFEETQAVTVLSQQFTAWIGNATVGGVPASLFHDNPSLWIAFAMDSTPDSELGVRTAITSGGYAHAAQLLTTPVVRTLNGLAGDIGLAAGSNVTITPSGNTLTIGATTTGLTAVSTDTTLLGNGTPGAPLGVAAGLQLTRSGGNTITANNDTGTAVNAVSQGSGVGVYGFGGTTGVWGSSTGFGVLGFGKAGVVGHTGIYTLIPSTGVSGFADNTGTGVVGAILVTTPPPAPPNTGVAGFGATGVSGTTNTPTTGIGVSGTNTTSSGFGVVGQGDVGVWGSGVSTGVSGHSTNTGVFGDGAVGVQGTSASGVGVWGESTGASGVAEGVHGVAHGGASGVTGVTDNLIGIGVSGQNLAGGLAGRFEGRVVVTVLGSAGSTPVCHNAVGQLATCSSSLRYKSDVRPFNGGLDIVNRLRPIAFVWKQGGMTDVGLGAEDVAQVEPLLTFRNDQGEIEGVKYNQLSAVFVNAFIEQQAQIKQQQETLAAQQHELATLKALLCSAHPDADVCR